MVSFLPLTQLQMHNPTSVRLQAEPVSGIVDNLFIL